MKVVHAWCANLALFGLAVARPNRCLPFSVRRSPDPIGVIHTRKCVWTLPRRPRRATARRGPADRSHDFCGFFRPRSFSARTFGLGAIGLVYPGSPFLKIIKIRNLSLYNRLGFPSSAPREAQPVSERVGNVRAKTRS